MGKLIFPRKTVERLTSLLEGGFYIEKIGADKYVICPKTVEASETFRQTVRALCSIGYKELNTSKPNCAMLKLPARKLKLATEHLSAGETLERHLESRFFDLQPTSTEMQKEGWKHIIVLARIGEFDDYEQQLAILKDMIPTLESYGYRCMLDGNALFVSSSEACKEHADEAAEIRKIIAA